MLTIEFKAAEKSSKSNKNSATLTEFYKKLNRAFPVNLIDLKVDMLLDQDKLISYKNQDGIRVFVNAERYLKKFKYFIKDQNDQIISEINDLPELKNYIKYTWRET